MAIGFVSLVGAGPGDPELLTRRAAARLADADVVLFDALVPAAVLALAGRTAQRFSVGKRAGAAPTDQAAINRLLVRLARRGRHVVRLKCGDPFVFGRGGEEGLALAAAGVPFEVVPGVTAALAAPALAGIPVTHRGIASALVIVSGHAERAYAPVLATLEPGTATVVVLMGLATRGDVSRFLVERGWPRSTPAAVVTNAGQPDSTTWTGSLDRLSAAPVPRGTAGTIVIGAVVGLRSRLACDAPPADHSFQELRDGLH